MLKLFEQKINYSNNFSFKNYLYNYNFLRKELYRYDKFIEIKKKLII